MEPPTLLIVPNDSLISLPARGFLVFLKCCGTFAPYSLRRLKPSAVWQHHGEEEAI